MAWPDYLARNEDDERTYQRGLSDIRYAHECVKNGDLKSCCAKLKCALDIFERVGYQRDVDSASKLLAKIRLKINKDDGQYYWVMEKETREEMVVNVSVYRGETTYFRCGDERDLDPENFIFIKKVSRPKKKA